MGGYDELVKVLEGWAAAAFFERIAAEALGCSEVQAICVMDRLLDIVDLGVADGKLGFVQRDCLHGGGEVLARESSKEEGGQRLALVMVAVSFASGVPVKEDGFGKTLELFGALAEA